MKPVPLGVPGRLYVSGVCLARGYLHKPQLTAEAFIANPFFDPFADPPAFSRMFDTSVLSRWLPGGMLDFVGHADRQVGRPLSLLRPEQGPWNPIWCIK